MQENPIPSGGDLSPQATYNLCMHHESHTQTRIQNFICIQPILKRNILIPSISFIIIIMLVAIAILCDY